MFERLLNAKPAPLFALCPKLFRKKTLLYSFLCLSVMPTYGQLDLPIITQPSPNASSLGVHGSLNVSYYNGLPQTSLPLMTLEMPGFTSDISLSYNSGGIRVNQVASWVGMGWTLNAGGVITRVVRGIADEESYGYADYIGNPVPSSFTPQSPGPGSIANFQNFAFGRSDGEPDEFYFNFGSYSGKFVKDQQGNFMAIPHQNLKFESVGFASFTITDPEGNKYYFNSKESNISSVECNTGCAGGSQQRVAAWYLTTITTTLGRVVTFEYENYQTARYATGLQETVYYPSSTSQGIKTTFSQVIEGKRLKKIIYDGGVLEFVTGTDRCDLSGDKPLKQLLLKNRDNKLVKKFELDYSYMYGLGGTTWSAENAPCGDALLTRLFLSKVTEANVADSGSKKPPYLFSYFDGLPSRLSFAQDHWGYFNFNPTSTLVPSTHFSRLGVGIFHQGAYREPAIERAKCGTLSKIVFPTGGEQEFEYELNEVTSSSLGLSPNFTIASTSMNSILHDVNPLTFNVPSITFVWIKLSGSGVSGSNPSQWPVKFTIRNSSNTIVYTTTSSATLQDVLIPNFASGQYTLHYEVLNPGVPLGTSGNYYGIDIRRNEVIPSTTGIKVGGLRIKKIITTNTSASPTVPARQYLRFFEYKDGNGMSTGRITFSPDYSPVPFVQATSYANEQWSTTVYSILSSMPAYVLENTAGGIAGYAKVTEYHSNYNPYNEYGQNGKTEYYYTTSDEYPDDYKNIVDPENQGSYYYESQYIRFPFSPPTSRDWKRGKLLQQIDYKKVSTNVYQPVRKIANEYNFVQLGQIRPLKVAITARYPMPDEDFSSFWYNYYVIGTGYTTLKKVTTTDYTESSSISKTVDYSYNANLLTTSITESLSAGSRQTLLKYPQDYAGTAVYDNMVSAHQIAPVISKTVTKNGVSESVKTNYNFWQAGAWGNSSSLIRLPQTVETSVRAATPEVRVRFHTYNDQGAILTQSKEHDVKESYVWGYNGIYPVAKVINATAAEIAYTSFETNETGNFVISNPTPNSSNAITGKNSFTLSAGKTISKSGLPDGKSYIVSYWSMNGAVTVNAVAGVARRTVGSWTLWEHMIVAPATSVSITGNGQVIDELRLHPAAAQMTTTTFEPLVGMTSSSDEKNTITFYEFDGFGRLILVRDINRNILKRICYNYAGQPENCNNP